MTNTLETLVEELSERVALRVLARVSEAQPSTYLWIKEAPYQYRILARAVASGELPARRIGAKTMVARTDLDAWVARQPLLSRRAPDPVPVEPDEVDRVIQRSAARRRSH